MIEFAEFIPVTFSPLIVIDEHPEKLNEILLVNYVIYNFLYYLNDY